MNYLKLYQSSLGLNPDGIIGPITAKAIMDDQGVTNKIYFGHAMGQARKESDNWTAFRENMNYSRERLLTGPFSHHYKGHEYLAAKHANHPVAIANYVYANKNGNGDENSGDGWKYRGTFALQLTGRNNIIPFLLFSGLSADTDPDSLKDNAKVYFSAIFYYFQKNDVIKYCKDTSINSIDNVGKKVNRGNALAKTPLAVGNAERREYSKEIFKAIGLS